MQNHFPLHDIRPLAWTLNLDDKAFDTKQLVICHCRELLKDLILLLKSTHVINLNKLVERTRHDHPNLSQQHFS